MRKRMRSAIGFDPSISERTGIFLSAFSGSVDNSILQAEIKNIKKSENHNTSCFLYDCSRNCFAYISENFETIFQNRIHWFYTDGFSYLEKLCHPDDIDPLFRSIASFADIILKYYPDDLEFSALSIEFRLLMPDKKYSWVLLEMSPAFDNRSKEISLLKGTLYDLRELKTDAVMNGRIRVRHVTIKMDLLESILLNGPLSKRETELLLLLQNGLTSKEISSRLRITIHTVNNHRKNIMRKLNVRSIIEGINAARKIGIL